VRVELDYAAAGIPIRADLEDAHAYVWEHLRAPGTWWSGRQRVAIAAETRQATRCRLCRARKAALSPTAVSGEHDHLGALSDHAVEVVHRVRTDPARLSRAWFESIIASGLSQPEYVELIAVVTLLTGVDYVARALGIESFPLPEPLPGEPSRRLPTTAKPGMGWVPMIAPEDATGPEADLYGDAPVVPNIVRALSMVPDEVRALRRTSESHYVPLAKLGDPTFCRSLDRMQMELVAARVSALNECFY
jgi:alkylhydroperoxidase family enzyme